MSESLPLMCGRRKALAVTEGPRATLGVCMCACICESAFNMNARGCACACGVSASAIVQSYLSFGIFSEICVHVAGFWKFGRN